MRNARGKYRSLLQFAKNRLKLRLKVNGVNVVVYEGSVPRREEGSLLRVVSEVRNVYLLGSYYHGRARKVYLKFYSDSENRVYVWFDKTGHQPYFLTNASREDIERDPRISKDSAFERVEVVRKVDLLSGKQVTLSKIVVKDPQAVPRLRKVVTSLGANVKVWEAKIKYHDNYLFDRGLIPGMLYDVRGSELRLIRPRVEGKKLKLFLNAIRNYDPELQKYSLEFTQQFETRPPKMKRLAIDIEVYTPFRGRIPDPERAAFPIMSIALVGSDGLKKVLVLKRPNTAFGDIRKLPEGFEVEIFDNEYYMIIEAVKVIKRYPLILTFNGDDFDLPYLNNRALKVGVDPELLPFERVRDFVGIKHGFHIDLYKFFSIEAIQNYAFGGIYREKTLDAVAQALLGEAKVRIEESISDLSMADLVEYNAKDAEITLKLTTFGNELVWKLIVLIMRLARMSLEDVTRRKVSAWIKNLLYWEHRRRGYLIPNKEDLLSIKGKVKTAARVSKKSYAGALVIDPISGVYFNVHVLDFASLYPSIIKVWNLSYETIDPPPGWCSRGGVAEIRDEGGEKIHEVCRDRRGIASELVGLLRDFRVNVYKKLTKSEELSVDERNWYDVVQKAMKVYINASYGVFGHREFPFYTPSVAESVTALGRYVISQTLRKASEMGLKVLYGDTDSLFLWNPDESKLKELQEWVEEKFQLDLELDKIYKFVAFTLKKNYIGVYEDSSVDIKGLVGKKRNVPKLLQDTFTSVVESLKKLEGNPESLDKIKEEIRRTVQDLYLKLKNRDFTLDEVAFRTTLNKAIEEYTKTTPQHVKAAIQLRNYGVAVGKGDIIFLVKTKTRDDVKAIQLARLDDVDINEYLKAAKSIFQQLLIPFNIKWEEIAGNITLAAFVERRIF